MEIHFEYESEKELIFFKAKGRLLFPFIHFTNDPRTKILKFIKTKKDGTVIERIYQQEYNGKDKGKYYERTQKK